MNNRYSSTIFEANSNSISKETPKAFLSKPRSYKDEALRTEAYFLLCIISENENSCEDSGNAWMSEAPYISNAVETIKF
ncbi:hypothetical protein NPIL_483881 [Nephila pilipes]|uniref:Uncharacterized protein n=1 Tax=Nephila pilipes TaxID=299642 RepID=A0A8X6T2Y0_NEPPI|nr:hypothetical protein NPIL_483881 [Nephila pilipes]